MDEPQASSDEPLPFGVPEILAAVAGARRILDVGCGSGRLTLALARDGSEASDVTGIDTSRERLDQARSRATNAGAALCLVEADFEQPLPFADASFDAVTSRLALMIADDPVATLAELRRVLGAQGTLVTVVWAALSTNPWLAAPREAVAAVLGPERASFARAFGRLGDPEEAAAVHRAAGLLEVEARLLTEHLVVTDAAEHWEALSRENGHFRRVAAALDESHRDALLEELERRLEPYREDGVLVLPRTLVLVTARR